MVTLGLEQFARVGVPFEGGHQPIELVGRSGRDGRSAAHQAEQLGSWKLRPLSDVREEVARRHQRRRGEAHVLGDHRCVVVGATPEVCDELLVSKAVGVDRLQLPVHRDRGRLDHVVPFAQLLPPQLPLEQLLRTGDPRRSLCLRDRLGGLVGEAVDVGHFKRAEQHPVEAGEVADAVREGLGMGFRPVARGRAREVDWIKLPRSRARRLEAKFGRDLCAGHGMSSPSRCWRRRASRTVRTCPNASTVACPLLWRGPGASQRGGSAPCASTGGHRCR